MTNILTRPLDRLTVGFLGFRFFRNTLFFQATLIPFYAERGFSVSEVFALEGVFWATFVICEIPTGLIADYYGRRKALIVGLVIASVGLFFQSSSSTFPQFAVCLASAAIGWSLCSGADSALLFAGLESRKEEARFPHVESIGQLMRNVANALSVVAGFLLAKWLDSAAPIFLTSLTTFSALFFILLLPHANLPPRPRSGWHRALVLQLRSGGRVGRIAVFSTLYATLFFTDFTGFWFIQLWLSNSQSPLGAVLIYALLLIATSLMNLKGGVLAAVRKDQVILLLMCMTITYYGALGLTAGLADYSRDIVALIAFSSYAVLRAGYQPAIRAWLNEAAPAEYRATVLSGATWAAAGAAALLFPLIGVAIGRIGFEPTCSALAAVCGFTLLACARAHARLAPASV